MVEASWGLLKVMHEHQQQLQLLQVSAAWGSWYSLQPRPHRLPAWHGVVGVKGSGQRPR